MFVREMRRRDPLYGLSRQTRQRSTAFLLAGLVSIGLGTVAAGRYAGFDEAPIAASVQAAGYVLGLVATSVALWPLERAPYPKRRLRPGMVFGGAYALAIASLFLDDDVVPPGYEWLEVVILIARSAIFFGPVVAVSRVNLLNRRLFHTVPSKRFPSREIRRELFRLFRFVVLGFLACLAGQFVVGLAFWDVYDALALAAVSLLWPGLLFVLPIGLTWSSITLRSRPGHRRKYPTRATP